METTEPTEEILTAEQEKTQIAEIAKASILNIAKNKEAYEALRDEYTGITLPEFKDPEFKKIYKKVTEGSGKLVKARTAADKLVKSELALLDEVKTMIKSAGEDLKAITSETEKEIKAEKERADQMIKDEKQEALRQLEEKKQARIANLFELGAKFNGAYYEIGDLTLTPIQVTQYSEAQFEGFIAQATVAYEAEQLRIAEEEAANVKRLADEKKAQEENAAANLRAQELLTQENAAKQKIIDEANAKQKEQDDLIASLQAQIKAQEATKPNALEILPSADIKPAEAPKNGSPIKFTEAEKESILHDVLVGEEGVKADAIGMITGCLYFTDETPFVDTMIGKATLRIYVEQTLDAAQDGLTPDMVAASGSIGDELLFLVIKGK